MDFLGESLGQRLRCSGVSREDIFRIGLRSLSLLKRMHRAGFVHCDVRPENIMLSGESGEGLKVSLIDFSMAHDLRDLNGEHIEF